MKIVALLLRVVLALIFLIFGINGFVHFIHLPALAGVASQFMGALALSHYFDFIYGLEIVGGALLLLNRFVPLGIVLLGPIVINIVFFHALMAPDGMARALFVTVLWIAAAWMYRKYLASIFIMKTDDLG